MLNKTKFTFYQIKEVFMLVFIVFFICGTTNKVFGASSEKRYIFIDGGADSGRVFNMFQAVTSYLPQYSWEIFAIEPNPNVLHVMPKFPNLTIIPKAIWITKGDITFYQNLEPDRNSTGSLFKKELEQPRKITVASMDFSQWIKGNFTIEDYIILNIDIEEAEYAVLEKMLKDKTIMYIDRLFVEFNNDHRPENLKRKNKILQDIKKIGIPVQTSSLWEIILNDIFGSTHYDSESFI